MKLAEFLFIVLVGAAIYCLTVWKIACSGQKVEMKYLEIGIAGLVLISVVGQRTFSLISSMSAEHADESESLQLAQTIYQQGNSDLQNRLCDAYVQIGRRDEQIASLSQAIRRNRADKELTCPTDGGRGNR